MGIWNFLGLFFEGAHVKQSTVVCLFILTFSALHPDMPTLNIGVSIIIFSVSTFTTRLGTGIIGL